MTEQIISWNEKPTNVILLLIFFFPIGIYFMWKNEIFSKKTRVVVSLVFGLILVMSKSPTEHVSVDNSVDNKILIEELTNGKFDDGVLKFNDDNTFSFIVDDGPSVTGVYKIGSFRSSENDGGYVGMRHLYWKVTFKNVTDSYYWDEDNTMSLRYDWNHSESDKKLILKGESKLYPIEIEKSVNGDKLVKNYWVNKD